MKVGVRVRHGGSITNVELSRQFDPAEVARELGLAPHLTLKVLCKGRQLRPGADVPPKATLMVLSTDAAKLQGVEQANRLVGGGDVVAGPLCPALKRVLPGATYAWIEAAAGWVRSRAGGLGMARSRRGADVRRAPAGRELELRVECTPERGGEIEAEWKADGPGTLLDDASVVTSDSGRAIATCTLRSNGESGSVTVAIREAGGPGAVRTFWFEAFD